jgi:3-hydroxyisobutyrate dehydrogenase-like beta-hydroxyacid dehydrogenase
MGLAGAPRLGIMGAAIARNLASADMQVRVWNRPREKAYALARADRG